MSDQLHTDAGLVPAGPTFAEWLPTQPDLAEEYSRSGSAESFDDWARATFVDRHNLWDIIGDTDEGVQRLIDVKVEQLRLGVPVRILPQDVGSLVRRLDPDSFLEDEDKKKTDDVDEHLLVFESDEEREALADALAPRAGEKIDASVDRYSGDTGGTRIITAEVYRVIERLHQTYSTDPGRSKHERSFRAISREINQDLLTRWKELGLNEPVVVSDVTIDKIIRGVYRSQLKHGIPSEQSFRGWESGMHDEAGAYKSAAQDREARKAFEFTRRVLIGMAMHLYRQTQEDPGALTALLEAADETEFRAAADKYLKRLFTEHGIDFPEGWTFGDMRREVLFVANNMRYPDDVPQAWMRTMFRIFTPAQRNKFIHPAEAEEKQRALPYRTV